MAPAKDPARKSTAAGGGGALAEPGAQAPKGFVCPGAEKALQGSVRGSSLCILSDSAFPPGMSPSGQDSISAPSLLPI